MKLFKSAQILFIISTISFLASCSRGPKPIDYGNDACHYCQMTVVDQTYGAEIVTDKGKIFKFDAVECLMRYKRDLDDVEGYQFLTNYLSEPSQFVMMEKASYLISENLPSPMGANLTAFKTLEAAQKMKAEKDGVVLSWDDLNKHFNN